MHICKDKAQFKSYKEVIDKKVLMGNHSVAKVLGQDNVQLQFISGNKLTLKNVLHVLKLEIILYLLFYFGRMVLKPF